MGEAALIHGDRRNDRRYGHELELWFSYDESDIAYVGFGRTQDMSRGGIRFITDCPPPNGARVELRISWPFLLQNVCPLELAVRGSILKTDARGTVLQVREYEFRTCGDRSFTLACASVVDCGIVA
jgi:PilZ domain